MNYLLPVLFLAVGLILLVLGGDLLRRGLTALTKRLGVAPLLIGLAVVALGATTPQLAVTALASYRGTTDLALGTIVGSVVFHVLLVLGLSALVAPLTVSARWIRLAVPWLILAALALLGMGWDGVVSRSDGAMLLGAMVLWWLWTMFRSGREAETVRHEFAQLAEIAWPSASHNVLVSLLVVLAGLSFLALGAWGVVQGATPFAAMGRGVLLVLGLTVVAIGTSWPELVASLRATRSGQQDVVVGQVVGDSLTTLLGVAGIAALLAPQGLSVDSGTLRFDLALLIATAVFCLPIFFLGSQITRWEGLFFVACYALYLTSLIVRTMRPGWSLAYLQLLVLVLLPLAVILAMLGVLKTLRRRRPSRPARHRIRGI